MSRMCSFAWCKGTTFIPILFRVDKIFRLAPAPCGQAATEKNGCADCDYRIVYAHWGIEFINYPYNDQKQFAHYMVDCGADLVMVCTHT